MYYRLIFYPYNEPDQNFYSGSEILHFIPQCAFKFVPQNIGNISFAGIGNFAGILDKFTIP